MQDIRNVAYRRNSGVNLFVYGCRVQGVGADETIIKAIQELDKLNLDVIIVARGGGSSEDLDCFNSEKLARVVFDCKTPIVSAVGHETDFTIIDFVADKRAPTPSAGAELVVANVEAQKDLLKKYISRLKFAMTRECADGERRTKFLMQKLGTILNHSLLVKKQEMLLKTQKLDRFENELLLNRTNHINVLCKTLEKINPLTVMARGFAQIETTQIVKSIDEISIGEKVKIHLKDGTALAEIKEKTKREARNEI